MKKIRYSTDDFIICAQKQHGNIYDYSNTVYQTSHEPVTIICRKHGPFTLRAYTHKCDFNGHTECFVLNALEGLTNGR